jgi:2-aminoethylphosphonate-pyruvate transaminase
MLNSQPFSSWKDKILFTPGPLTTSQTVKQAMLRDLGSRDHLFINLVKEIRQSLVTLGQADLKTYTAVPLQGSGTFGLEAVIGSAIPPGGKFLVINNGAYGQRLVKIATRLNIETIDLKCPENSPPSLDKIKDILNDESGVSLVAATHCETTTGIMNPIEAIGLLVKQSGAKYFVDAMSSFGAVPINLAQCHIDYLVSSANKCIEGVPGFSFVLAKISSLKETDGYARSLSFDLLDQYLGLEKNGQFRFTPPTHVLLAFHQALVELEAEGGVAGRAKRYRRNYELLTAGMREMGFKEYLPPEDQGYIITSFLFPDDPHFNFETFYNKLNERDQVIYPGKVSDANCFRIGSIGRVFEADIKMLLAAIGEVIDEMGVRLS